MIVTAAWRFAFLLPPSCALAQDSTAVSPRPSPPAVARAAVPFGFGERADYGVKYGIFSVGRASTEVFRLDTIRGRESWHILFQVRGGLAGFRVDDRMESWMDTATLASLRFRQDMMEGSHERERVFEIFPERGTYTEDGKEPQPTVPLPLDDGSFLFFVRTIPLEIGKEYSFNRYFRPDRNPVRIQVLRKEQVTVPAGTFEAIVIRPIIKARGVFSEGGRAEVWLTDDSRRLMVQLKTHMKLGSLSLFLRSYTPSRVIDSTWVAR
jgi:hypothetical protein